MIEQGVGAFLKLVLLQMYGKRSFLVIYGGQVKLFFVFSSPSGCFFTSSGGLRSYEHPNELKAVPRVDSSGEVCGMTFKVDEGSRKGKTAMPRVGSDANWSQHY